MSTGPRDEPGTGIGGQQRRIGLIDTYVHRVGDEESERIRRFLYLVAAGTIGFVLFTIALIATVPWWIGIVSHESEREFAAPHVAWVKAHLLEAAQPDLAAYVERVGRGVAGVMDVPPDLELSFDVVRGDTPNAFATLGGHIFVIDSLLSDLDSENSLAMVLAHEIAHAVNRDPLTGAGRGVLLQVMISALSGGGFDASSSADFGVDATLNGYSRAQEQEADELAVAALARRYGHVGGAKRLFEVLLDRGGAPDVPAFLSSHPELADRIAAIDRQSALHGWQEGDVTPLPPELQGWLSSGL